MISKKFLRKSPLRNDFLFLASFVRNSEAATRGVLRKGVLRNFAEFTGKHLHHSLLFNKVAGLSLQLYLKGETGTGVFLWILRNFQEHLIYITTVGDGFCSWKYRNSIHRKTPVLEFPFNKAAGLKA